MSLATLSKDLKLFDINEDFKLTASVPVQLEKESFGRITWSGDGKWFAVAPYINLQSSLPIIKYKENQLSVFKHISLSTKVRSASFFSCTNRHIALGNDNGEIFIWDIKEKKIGPKFQNSVNKSNVDFLSVNTEDKYLASASLDDNHIFLHGLKTNKKIDTYEIPNSKGTSALYFCPTKKNYLSASSLESMICIWDITKSDYVFKHLNAHKGACMDIKFSPVNYSVIASVALTKDLKMYDWREKKVILEVDLQEPLTCIDFLVGGVEVAVGTSSGSIIVYDLRSSEITHQFKAHEDPVLCVKSNPMKVPKAYDDVDINTPDVVEPRNKTLDISVIDIVSPISAGKSEGSVNSSKRKSFHSTPRLNLDSSEDSFLSKIVSPVLTVKKASISPNLRPPLEDLHFSPIARSVNGSVFNSPLPQIKEEEQSPQTVVYDDKCIGDGIQNGVNDVDLAKEILKELQFIRNDLKEVRNDQKEGFQKLSNEINSVKEDLNLTKEFFHTKLEHMAGDNLQFRVDNVCHRIIMNNLSDECEEYYKNIAEEFRLNTERLNHIYKMLDDLSQ